MTCNHCHPLCQCGAEAEAERAGMRLLEQRVWTAADAAAGLWAGMSWQAAPRFPELEAMEAALTNYDGAA